MDFFLEAGRIGIVRSALLTLVVVRQFQLTGEAVGTEGSPSVQNNSSDTKERRRSDVLQR